MNPEPARIATDVCCDPRCVPCQAERVRPGTIVVCAETERRWREHDRAFLAATLRIRIAAGDREQLAHALRSVGEHRAARTLGVLIHELLTVLEPHEQAG